MFVVKNIRLPIDRPADDAFCEAARRAGLPAARAGGAFVYRRALDARRERPSFVYTIGFPGDMPAGGGPDVSPVAEYEPPAVSSAPRRGRLRPGGNFLRVSARPRRASPACS